MMKTGIFSGIEHRGRKSLSGWCAIHRLYIPFAVLSLSGCAVQRDFTMACNPCLTNACVVNAFDTAQLDGLFSKRRNSLQGYHGTWADRPSYAKMSLVDNAALRWGRAGRSLAVAYDRREGSCGWYTTLDGLDISAYDYLGFQIRGDAGGERLLIGFMDDMMKAYNVEPFIVGEAVDFLQGPVSPDWQLALIPLSRLSDTLNRAAMGQLVLEFPEQPPGRILIDEIAFYEDAGPQWINQGWRGSVLAWAQKMGMEVAP
jgi:hypothetical protein